jgi:hypothetical protein
VFSQNPQTNQSSRVFLKTEDTMEAIDSAISLNNDGVSLLVAGDDQAAAVALSHALSLWSKVY